MNKLAGAFDSNPPDDTTLYGKQWAADYDETDVPPLTDTTVAVKTLVQLAHSGSVLEVAAGTGRIAIPLAQAGLKVTASDSSPEMLQILQAKDKQHLVQCRLDILPAIAKDQRYELICILLNSIWVMRSAELQRDFLRNAAARLRPGGRLVIEMGVANPQNWVRPLRLKYARSMATRTTVWNPVTQEVRHTIVFDKTAATPHTRRQLNLRILMPQELLLMAELEGFELETIWSDWQKQPFDSTSTRMITVLRRKASKQMRN